MAGEYTEIVEGCRRHQRQAQRELYERLAPMAMGVCMRYVRNREEARDLVQDGFIRVFEHIGQLKDAEKTAAWVRSVMVNECLRHFRRQRLPMAETEGGVDAAVWPADPFGSEEIVLALQRIAPQQQVVFNLVAVEEYSYKEAAQKLHCTEVNVRALYSRACAALRAELRISRNEE